MKDYEMDKIAKEFCKEIQFDNENITAIMGQEYLAIRYAAVRKNAEYEKQFLIHKSQFVIFDKKELLENFISYFVSYMRGLERSELKEKYCK